MLRTRKRALLALILLCVAVRVPFGLWSGPPDTYEDTVGYVLLASMLTSHDFSQYDGFRTPLYPVLMLLCGNDPVAIFVAQLVLGVLVSVLLYAAFEWISGSRGLGLLVAAAYSLNLSQLLYEANLLTETLTTCLLSLALLLAFRAMRRDRAPGNGLLALVGSIAALAALARPLCAVATFAIVAFVAYCLFRNQAARRRWLVQTASLVAPVVILLGGWSVFNQRTTGTLALSTLTGMNLTHWSGAYMEDAPVEFAPIPEIFIRHRDARGTSEQTIWAALSELEERTGLSSPQLSEVLKKISIQIIARRPREYLVNVAGAWIDFWKPSFLYKGRDPNSALVGVTRLGIAGLELVFLLGPLLWLASKRVRAQVQRSLECLLVYVVVLATSVVQALLITVENPRYSISVAPWIVGMALYVGFVVLRSRAAQRSGARL